MDWWTIEEAHIKIAKSIASSTMLSWITEGLWKEGMHYTGVSGRGHAGRQYRVNPQVFSDFTLGVRYINGSEASRILNVSAYSFWYQLANELPSVRLPRLVSPRENDIPRLYPFPDVYAYKRQRDKLFKPGVEYLSRKEAAVFLGITQERVRQLQLPDAVFIPASRSRWWYPKPTLEDRKVAVNPKGGRPKKKR